MISKKTVTGCVTLMCGVVGGILGAVVWTEGLQMAWAQSRPAALEAREFRLLDANNRLRMQLATSREGPPAMFVYDDKGRARLVAGVYSDGQPFIVLNDENSQAAGIFRLAGSNQSPVLVFKHAGQDRMLMGLQMDGDGNVPFLKYLDGGAMRDALAKPR